MAGQLSEELRRPLQLQGQAIVATGSVGIATYPVDGTDADVLLQRADEAMYEVKHSGRDGFCFRSGS